MTVKELIERLQKFDEDKLVILDDDGNTYGLDDNEIDIWNESDPESPIAIYI
jgi:hypothetical protein